MVERMKMADCWPNIALIQCIFHCWKWKHLSSECQNVTAHKTVTTEMRTTIINLQSKCYPEEGGGAARTPACWWPSCSVSSLWPGSWRKVETHLYWGLAVIHAVLCSPWSYKPSTFVSQTINICVSRSRGVSPMLSYTKILRGDPQQIGYGESTYVRYISGSFHRKKAFLWVVPKSHKKAVAPEWNGYVGQRTNDNF